MIMTLINNNKHENDHKVILTGKNMRHLFQFWGSVKIFGPYHFERTQNGFSTTLVTNLSQ